MCASSTPTPTRGSSVTLRGDRTEPADVVVAVPARDEQSRLGACLESIRVAARAALASGAAGRVQVVVGANRCTDATVAVAESFLERRPVLRGLVLRDDVSATVGEVRRTAVQTAVRSLPRDPGTTWVFSTDADSTVPRAWITDTLRQARETGAVAVAGLVDLDSWHAGAHARLAYARIISAGVRAGGHDHVYGANLAVRLDAYVAVGGFEAVPVGEDRALVERLRAAGWVVLASVEPVVRTSARMPGREASA